MGIWQLSKWIFWKAHFHLQVKKTLQKFRYFEDHTQNYNEILQVRRILCTTHRCVLVIGCYKLHLEKMLHSFVGISLTQKCSIKSKWAPKKISVTSLGHALLRLSFCFAKAWNRTNPKVKTKPIHNNKQTAIKKNPFRLAFHRNFIKWTGLFFFLSIFKQYIRTKIHYRTWVAVIEKPPSSINSQWRMTILFVYLKIAQISILLISCHFKAKPQ